MAEYTYKDVIIDPEDPRVEIGKEYYYCDYPTGCLERAIKNDVAHLAGLENVDPGAIGPFFLDDSRSICIIRKKEAEKKYVPFDLSKEEDRAKLRGAWVRSKDDWKVEAFITEFYESCIPEMVCCVGSNKLSASELFRDWTFLDGSPCGKLVEKA